MTVLALPLASRAADVSVAGTVRDSSGVPQMDVMVELLRADSTLIRSVRTDEHGAYLIAGILPGVYQLKAIETTFLPTLKENLRVTKGRTQADLTLSTLLEALSWLPAHQRSVSEPQDDWTWTLRSAAYRPLLRYVDSDGLETVETADSIPAPRTRGRLLIESGTRAFADGGMHQTVELQHQDVRGGQMLMRGTVSDSSTGPAALIAGYSQQNQAGSGLTTVVSYQTDPGVMGGVGGGLHTMTFRTVDTVRLLPDVVVEAGSQLQVLSVGAQSYTAAQPFANLRWSHGDMSASYAVATTPQLQRSAAISDGVSYASLAGEQNRLLRVEHGLHQELKIEHDSPGLDASFAVYDDRIDDPAVDAMGMLASGDLAGGDYLFDPATDVARVLGSGYSSAGVVMQVRHEAALGVLGPVYEAVEYATGSALNAPQTTVSVAEKASSVPVFHPGTAQSVGLVLGGKMPRSGTTWRAAYRLQPGSTVTAVDLFDTGMADAYLSVFLRQPLHRSRIFPGGVDAIVNVRNLLAQGYHPFLTSDGSTLFFAQVDRSIQGGLAFYF